MPFITQNISSVPPLTTPPSPADPANFDALAYPYTISQNAFGLAMQALATELNIYAQQINNITFDAGQVNDQVIIATTQAGIATTQAGIATTQAGIATDEANRAAGYASAIQAGSNINWGAFALNDGELLVTYTVNT